MALEHARFFAIDDDHDLGGRIIRQLGAEPARHEERIFEDGEHKMRPLDSVRGRDVFIITSLFGGEGEGCGVNTKLCRLLFFIGTLKDADARSVTAVLPYLCYARKDRRTKACDPVTTRYVATLIEALGTDRVVALDVHNLAAFQNAFRCRTDHLEATDLFADYFERMLGNDALVVVSPDAGGIKRAETLRKALSLRLDRDIPTAFMEKYRSSGIVSGSALVGDVTGRTAIIVDDMIATGTTLTRAARACREHGAATVFAAATHGLFNGAAPLIEERALDGVVVTDTVPPFRLPPDTVGSRVIVLDSSPLFARHIRRIVEATPL